LFLSDPNVESVRQHTGNDSVFHPWLAVQKVINFGKLVGVESRPKNADR
jgi:hypothetical protein